MSKALINAVIALIEDRPKDAREMLRSPEVRVASTELQARLQLALRHRTDKAVIETLKDVIRVTLRADASQQAKDQSQVWDDTHYEAFLQGVAYVEQILENHIERLEP